MEFMDGKFELFEEYKKRYPAIEFGDNRFVKHFSSVEEEYNLLKHGVAIRDLSFYSKIFIHGKDSESLLERLATNKIIDLKVLEWAKTLFINNYGTIIDRTLLLKFEDYFILIGSNSEEKRLQKWIGRFVCEDDISLKDSSSDYSLFEIQGSQAGSYISMILGEKYSELDNGNVVRVQVEDFFIHGLKVADVNDVLKFVVLVESKFAIKMLEVMERLKSVYNFGMVGESAYNIFRIENGIPIAPNELNDNVHPVEVNLLDEVSTEKDDFIGHSSLNKSDENLGKLVKIVFSEDVNLGNDNPKIFDEKNDEVGIVTSFATNEILNSPIGLGFILRNYELEDSSFYVKINGKNVKITLYDL